MNTSFKFSFLSGNALKIIAAVCMLIDHIGFLFFPQYPIFRIIGRIAFPIFAFMIAEGCRYTKNKLRYFLVIFLAAILFQLVYFLYSGSLYMRVFITFSCSIPMVYALQYAKKEWFSKNASWLRRMFSLGLFLLSLLTVYLLTRFVRMDYGLWGALLPLFASLFYAPNEEAPAWFKKADSVPVHVLTMGIGLILLCSRSVTLQYFSLLSLPLLLLYSGKRGKWKMKYFFYVFYPAHILMLEGIRILIEKIL